MRAYSLVQISIYRDNIQLKMKIKLIDQNRVERVIEKKSGKILSKLKQQYEDITMSDDELEDITTESFCSTGSDIKIIDGSFSKLKPIKIGNNPGPSTFKPLITSTPKIGYANLSEDENQATNPGPSFKPRINSSPKMEYANDSDDEIEVNNPEPSIFKPTLTSKPVMECTNDIENVTFNYEEDILNEKLSCRKYLDEMTEFVRKTQNVVEAKLLKRALLLKKITKYQKKIRHMEKSLRRIDEIIEFGAQLPKFCEDFFKSV